MDQETAQYWTDRINSVSTRAGEAVTTQYAPPPPHDRIIWEVRLPAGGLLLNEDACIAHVRGIGR